MNYLNRLLVAGAGMIVISASSYGATINWGTSITPGDFFSDGTQLDAGVTFELGAFTPGFDPNSNDPSSWAANWTVIDTASYNPTLNNWGGEVETIDFTNAGVAAGTEIFVWAYNQQTIDLTTEWALFGATDAMDTTSTVDNWIAPGGPGDQGNPAIDWEPIAANNNVFGATQGGSGDGEVSNPQSLSGNQVQLFKVIPEPSTALLCILSSLTLLRRKR